MTGRKQEKKQKLIQIGALVTAAIMTISVLLAALLKW